MTAAQRVLRPGCHALVVVQQIVRRPGRFFGSSAKSLESSRRFFFWRYFDVLSNDDGRDGVNFTPLFFVNCQMVSSTTAFWDLVTRQWKFLERYLRVHDVNDASQI